MMRPDSIRCLIIDDEKLARDEMARQLAQHDRMVVVGEARRIDEALELNARLRPEAVFLDIRLRGESGFDFVFRAPEPLPHIIFVTAYNEYAVRAFECHALDYLLKPVHPERLVTTLRRLAHSLATHEKARNYAALLKSEIGEPSRLEKLGLTVREAEVLFWVAHAKSNPEIGRLLDKSAETVKKQIQSIVAKLNAKSRIEAALIAAEILQVSQK